MMTAVGSGVYPAMPNKPSRTYVATLLLAVCVLASHAQSNDISLAALFSPERLNQLLKPREQWQPYPTISNRTEWAALPEELRQTLIHRGEEALTNAIPALPATLYLEYKRAGNRSRFEAVVLERRSMLHNLVIAECVETRGRFLDALANILWATCEESSWSYPAHIGVQPAGVGLPDISTPVVDLFAAETGASLAWTHYLLAAALDKVSPLLRPRIQREINVRILTPVIETDFAWMGFNKSAGRPNNWNPWINANVLTATLLMETNAARRVTLVHKTLRSLDRFVQPYPKDGSCDEGPGYWGHAGGSLFDNLDLLHSASAGRIDVFKEPLIQEIGRFIYRAHIANGWYIPVGDCPAKMDCDRSLVFRFGRQIADDQMTHLAAQGATISNVVESARFLGRELRAVFTLPALLQTHITGDRLVRDVWLGSDDMQLLAARNRADSCAGLYLAAWGAHNAQSHNHNDVGNFIVFADGQPVFVDVGAPTYTAQTFSSRRYDIWAFQSAYHNLPTINGTMQAPGRHYAARNVKQTVNDRFAELTMDVAAAYPATAKAKSWVRTVRLNRGSDVVVTDSFELEQASAVTCENLITPCDVQLGGAGVLMLHAARGSDIHAPDVQLEFDPAKLEAAVEEIRVDDSRLYKSWGSELRRIVLRGKTSVLRDTWQLRIRERVR